VLQAELQGELDGLSKERDAYIAFEQGIQKSKAAVNTKGHGDGLDEYGIEGTQQEWDALMKRKKELEKEEADLTAELKAKEKELEDVHAEQEVVKRDEALVEQEEEE
jgi:beclin 1